MTEVGLATLNPPSGVVKQGSIGRPIAGFSIALRDDEGEPIAAEAVGRIFIRTPASMAGYWQAPEATAEARSRARWSTTRPSTSPARLASTTKSTARTSAPT